MRLLSEGQHSVALIFSWPGAVFLFALVGCFALCQKHWWSIIRVNLWRSVVAAILIAWSTFVSTYVGVFGGVTTAVLIASPGRSHSSLFYISPVLMASIVGGFVAAGLVALALYIFTQRWDDHAWFALMLSSIVAIVAAVAINPQFLLILRRSSEGVGEDTTTFGRVFSTLLVFGYMLYGACAGYWVTRGAKQPTA